MAFFTASRSRSQGREGWSVIFRHPARLDLNTGKPGRRIRRGLGTSNDHEASALVDQLNEILRMPELWEPTARAIAASRFDDRVVNIFYDGLEATRVDFASLRESVIPLPAAEQGYRTVLLLGTTGAGKTTVVRQLIGTNPRTERFPSTGAAKTTMCDTELVTAAGDVFRAVVTFVPRDDVIDYLRENVSEAALAAFHGRDDATIERMLLDHVDQRFRFSYVLGRGYADGAAARDDVVDDIEDDDDADEPEDVDTSAYGEMDLEVTAQVVSDAVALVKALAKRHADMIGNGADRVDDERVLAEESLDAALRESDEVDETVDELITEIEKRYWTLDVGELRRNRQGWPTTWSWETSDRVTFIKVISRFSSNYAPLFGRLLTPLVNGIRVSGPFRPGWEGSKAPRVVLVDGEGLGHTPRSVATLSTHVAAQIQDVDAVLLVDNAAQPMQAASVAALKAIAVSGNASKLHVLFTHFDQVTGANLPRFRDREEHVLGSVESSLKAIGKELGPAAANALRERVERACFFAGDIQGTLDAKKKKRRAQSISRSIDQLDALLERLAHPDGVVNTGPSRPVLDRMALSLAVKKATEDFHARWRGLLGLEPSAEVLPEQWKRIEALCRRMMEGKEEYDYLRPVGDLLYYLQLGIYQLLQHPVRWEGSEPGDAEKQAAVDSMASAITSALLDLIRQRLRVDAHKDWEAAYFETGKGSVKRRAKIIAHDIYDNAAPVPSGTASPEQNRFLREVAQIVEAVAEDLDAALE